MDSVKPWPSPMLLALSLTIALLLIRGWLLYLLPLYDTTEARYAEIARIMFETNNWISPQIDYSQAFWGKPPMHTWMSAISFTTLGVSAFAARLPHFLCGLLILGMVYRFARNNKNQEAGIISCLILTSSVGFIIAMGMVMTDIALLLSVTLAMTSFWKAYNRPHTRFHGHLFFASLAMGMLVKGPVAVVIVGLALVSWSLWQKNLQTALRCLPWLSGMALFLSLTLPWYVLAEQQTPGFVNYFIIGEHFQRFLVPGWEGDLYGSAHQRPRGLIWLFWLLAAFPWSFLLLRRLFEYVFFSSSKGQTQGLPSQLSAYLFCWMISPMLLFTFAGNILLAYVLPGFTAMALLVALHSQLSGRLLLMSSISLILLFALVYAFKADIFDTRSEVELLQDSPALYAEHPLYYWKTRPFSASFYSRGQARLISEHAAMISLLPSSEGIFLVMEKHFVTGFSAQLARFCIEQRQSKRRVLFYCRRAQ